MLVLSRKRGEKVIVSGMVGNAGMVGNVEVCVVEVRGDKVRLGFTAPQEITVHREEVQRAIEAGKGKPAA